MIIDPFLTYYRENPDYNESDSKNEFDSMIARNDAVASFLEGKIDADYLLDFMAEEGIDPVYYVDSVEEAIQFMLQNPHLDLSIEYE